MSRGRIVTLNHSHGRTLTADQCPGTVLERCQCKGMFFTHVCLALLLGFAPAHSCREPCVRGVRWAALREYLSDSDSPEDALQEFNRTSCDRFSRPERRPKYLRLLREFAKCARFASHSKVSAQVWTGQCEEFGECTGLPQLKCCRGPPCQVAAISIQASATAGGASAHITSHVEI